MRIKIRDFLIDMFDFFTTKRLFSFLGKNWVVLIAFAIMACVIGFYFFQFSSYDLSKDVCMNTTGDEADCLSKDAARWGTFGDFVGGTLNPILSFLALIIVLKTYLSQQIELQETRKILKEQSETQKRQRFESTFFELLATHNKILDCFMQEPSPYMRDGESQKRQSDLEKIILDIFGNEVYCVCDMNPAPTSISLAKCKLMKKNHLHGHYFRTLYQLLKFIAINSNNEIDEKFSIKDIEKDDVRYYEKMYSNTIRALLPNDVMRLLAVNCYCENGKDDCYWEYKLLIERYEFFEHLSFDCNDERYKEIWQAIKEHYHAKAFGK